MDLYREKYRTGADTDFLVYAADGTAIAAHRVVLKSECDFFQNMLTHNTLENQTGRAQIKDTDATTLRLFIDYLYELKEGVHTLTDRDQVELLATLADKYQLQPLMTVLRTKSCVLDTELLRKDYAEHYQTAVEHGLEVDMEVIATRAVIDWEDFMDCGGVYSFYANTTSEVRDKFFGHCHRVRKQLQLVRRRSGR